MKDVRTKKLKAGRPPTGITRRPVSVSVTQEQYDRLHKYCAVHNTGTSRVIQNLIDAHLPA